MSPLQATLAEQFERHLAMLGAAIEAVPEDDWLRGDEPLLPARILLHAVSAVDFYLHRDVEDWKPHVRYHFDEETAPAEQLPGPAELAAYLTDIGGTWRAFLAASDDAALLGANGFPWTGPNPLARMIYTMRHSYEHVGEINVLLRQWDRPRVKWR